LPPPPAYYAQPYYPPPYFYGAYYYGPRFWRPYPYYVGYPYWRGPRFAYYGRPHWGGAWRGHGCRWAIASHYRHDLAPLTPSIRLRRSQRRTAGIRKELSRKVRTRALNDARLAAPFLLRLTHRLAAI